MSADEPFSEHGPDYDEFVERHGFLSWLGLTVESVESGRVVMSIPRDEKLFNPALDGGGGVVHGGIVASLVDTSSGFALRTTFENPVAARLTTTDLDVSYLRPATGSLTAEAEVVRAGGSMGVTDVVVRSTTPDGNETDVAVGRTSYRLFRDR